MKLKCTHTVHAACQARPSQQRTIDRGWHTYIYYIYKHTVICVQCRRLLSGTAAHHQVLCSFVRFRDEQDELLLRQQQVRIKHKQMLVYSSSLSTGCSDDGCCRPWRRWIAYALCRNHLRTFRAKKSLSPRNKVSCAYWRGSHHVNVDAT